LDGVRFEAKGQIAQLTVSMSTLTSLSISHTHLGAEHAAHFATLVAESALVSLSLVNCQLTDGGRNFSGVRKIIDALLRGTDADEDEVGVRGRLCSLRYLDLSHNLLAKRVVYSSKLLTVSHDKLEPYMRNTKAEDPKRLNTYYYGGKEKVVGNFEKGALYRYKGEDVHVIGLADRANRSALAKKGVLNIEVHPFLYFPWLEDSGKSPNVPSSDESPFASVVQHSPLHSLNLAHTRLLAVPSKAAYDWFLDTSRRHKIGRVMYPNKNNDWLYDTSTDGATHLPNAHKSTEMLDGFCGALSAAAASLTELDVSGVTQQTAILLKKALEAREAPTRLVANGVSHDAWPVDEVKEAYSGIFAPAGPNV